MFTITLFFLAPDVDLITITGVRISEVTETSLGVEWTPVECLQHNNLPLTVRIVVTQVTTGLSVGTVSVAHNLGNYTFTGLQPGTEYSFQLNPVYEDDAGRTETTVRAITSHGRKV